MPRPAAALAEAADGELGAGEEMVQQGPRGPCLGTYDMVGENMCVGYLYSMWYTVLFHSRKSVNAQILPT